MLYLFVASLIWSFSFGLIKTELRGLDPVFVALVRLGLSLAVFLPWLRPRRLARASLLFLPAVGAVQYGVMYMTYISAYAHLPAHQVALFTLFTPLFVVLVHAALVRRMQPAFFGAAALAVAGGAVIAWSGRDVAGTVRGILLLQASNLSFAGGQVVYRRWRRRTVEIRDRDAFALLYLGGVAVTAVCSLLLVDWTTVRPSSRQFGVLLYLGVLPSGLCFFLWNAGAVRVNAGTLAVFNNVKIPLAVGVSLLVFGESARPAPLAAGGVMIAAALFLCRRPPAREDPPSGPRAQSTATAQTASAGNASPPWERGRARSRAKTPRSQP